MTVGPPPDARSVRELITWLLKREQKTQEELEDLRQELSRMPAQWRADVDAVRAELQALSEEMIRRHADARLQLRLLGVGLIATGLALAWGGGVA